MSGNRVYLGYTNNGVHTVFGESTKLIIEARYKLAGQYGSDRAWQILPNNGPVGTFVHRSTFGPSHLGYLTGTLEEFWTWASEHKLEVVSSHISNFVPFSNGDYEEEATYALTDEQFTELFGFSRDDVSAISRLERRVTHDIASCLPPFDYWGKQRLPDYDYSSLTHLPEFWAPLEVEEVSAESAGALNIGDVLIPDPL